MTETMKHDAAARRYSLIIDGTEAGYADYVETGSIRDFNRTVTDPDHRGKGVAGRVVRYALDDSRATGFSIIPSCPFVDGFIAKNPEYKDLLA
ncbi:N-acetyltransferase [Hoyosella sp. G463]|uniref:N-acetyltransferase n=1 Tax=Lolliginicoccus lacisalsi TaxID=2742202 RepID=A0A927JAQ8_9ACTN|nr:GNAT family N-acetyltransferase [Lolliginicoccus lacisalsi]MBD8505690.1 N-acetyltransferase [Lolliginicoccus lacisalsi]